MASKMSNRSGLSALLEEGGGGSSRESSFSMSLGGSTLLSPATPGTRGSLRASRLTLGSSKRRGKPARASSRMSTSFSGATHAVAESQRHYLEPHGSYLPVLVVEALNFADATAELSVQLSEFGWAWLVCARRLLVWPLGHGGSAPGDLLCRELPLPPSDLAHRAQLVCVLPSGGDSAPAVMAASPEGLVRFWPSAAHEGSFAEISAELQGQECDSLTSLGAGAAAGCLLATTTSTVVLVTASGGEGGGDGLFGLKCRPLRVQHGWFGGIGRRLSSVIFGSMPSQTAEAKLVKVVAGDDSEIFVLAGQSLQKWRLESGIGNEMLVGEWDVDKAVRQAFRQALWEGDGGGRDGRSLQAASFLRTWLVDMQAWGSHVILMAAAFNPQGDNQQLHYALGTLNSSGDMSSFSVLNLPMLYDESPDSEMRSMRFVLVGNRAYLYSKRTLRCCHLDSPSAPLDQIPFPSPTERLLGLGVCQSRLLLFLSEQWLVTVVPKDDALEESTMDAHDVSSFMADPTLSSATFCVTDTRLQELQSSTNPVERLKGAFVQFCAKGEVKMQSLVQDLFPAGSADSLMDGCVLQVSGGILNDRPSTDPRWDDGQYSEGIGGMQSVLISNLLQGKQHAHRLFVSFLKGSRLWDKFGVAMVRERPMCTSMALCEHAEKIVAACTLHSLQAKHKPTISTAIKMVMENRGERKSDLLPHGDLFYTEVLLIDEIIPALVQGAEEVVASSSRPQENTDAITTANTIVLTMLKSALAFRQQNSPTQFSPWGATGVEYVPWTASSGTLGVRPALKKLYKLTLEQGVRVGSGASDSKVKDKLMDQLLDLVDLLLDGFRSQLDSLDGADSERHRSVSAQYRGQCTELIAPFLQEQDYERAAMLGEKYQEFGVLVRLCLSTNNRDRLDRYMDEFEEQGFRDFVFAWHLREGKRGDLLRGFKSGRHGEALSRFLSTANPLLGAIHNLGIGKMSESAKTFLALAESETTLLRRKKNQLGLAKLALLASGEDVAAAVERINLELDLITHQEALPQKVLDALGCDPDTMRVMKPIEIIQLYIGEENKSTDVIDFKKALDLLCFVEDEEERDIAWLQIWCQAVLRDSWASISIEEDTLDIITHSLVFRIAKLAFEQGEDVENLMPPLPTLLSCPELATLASNPSFEYFMKAGYEHIKRVLLG